MSREEARQRVACWECEATTRQPMMVVFGTPAKIVSTLPLCPRCYEACYKPLARFAPDPESPVRSVLIVEPDARGRGIAG